MIKRIFLRGLATLIPIVITIAIVVWIFNLIDRIFSKLFIDFFGPHYYFTGMGFIFAIVLIFVIGILMGNWFSKKIYTYFEKVLSKTPFIKTIYQSIIDMVNFFKKDEDQKSGPVVMVHFGECKLMGLVSRDAFDDLTDGIGKEGEVVVYLPMSYQLGGMTVVVPKSMVTLVSMTLEEGFRFAATAGMPPRKNQEPSDQKPKN